MKEVSKSWSTAFLVILMCGIISVIQTRYVGHPTIYAERYENIREEFHHHILYNKPMLEEWPWRWANTLNLRILTVYLAEAFARTLSISIHIAYILIDMVSLFLTLVLLFFFLRRWFESAYSIIAVLFYSALMPMTYALHFFHPWDRPGLLIWLLFAWAVRDDKFVATAILICVGVLNKYDSVALPALYFLTHVSMNNWRKTTTRTALLFIIAFSIFGLLVHSFPGGSREIDAFEQVIINIQDLIDMHITYPPLLAFLIPITLGAIGWKKSDRFSKASLVLGLAILFGPLFFFTNFRELRAEMGALLLMTPSFLVGFRLVLRQELGDVPSGIHADQPTVEYTRKGDDFTDVGPGSQLRSQR